MFTNAHMELVKSFKKGFEKVPSSTKFLFDFFSSFLQGLIKLMTHKNTGRMVSCKKVVFYFSGTLLEFQCNIIGTFLISFFFLILFWCFIVFYSVWL